MPTSLGTATLDLKLTTQSFTGQLDRAVKQMRQGLEKAAAVEVKLDSRKALADARQLRAELQKELKLALQLDVSALDLMAGKIQAVTGNLRTVAGELRDAARQLRETRSSGSGGGSGGGSPPRAGSGGAGTNEYAAQLRLLQSDLRATTLSTAQFEAATRTLKSNIDAEITSLRSAGVLTREQQARLDALRVTSGQAGAALTQLGNQAAAAAAAAARATAQQAAAQDRAQQAAARIAAQQAAEQARAQQAAAAAAAAAARQAAQAQSEAVARLGRDLQVAQSQYQRGALGIREYLREMERVRAAGQSMASGLAAGSREAQALERVMASLGRNRAAINDQSIVKLRSDLAGARAEFERATAAAGRFNFIGQRQATQAYEAQLRTLETRIRSVGERSTATAAQIRTLNQMSAQIGSQRNLLNGQSTGLGISGSVLTALRQLPQFAAAAGGSLGAAAAQASAFGGSLTGLSAAAGPVGIAVAAVTASVVAVGAALVSTVGPAAKFQQTLVDIKALTQPTTAELAALKQATMDIGTPLGVGAREAAAAVLELNRAGLSATDVVGGGLSGALTLAGAAGEDAASGARQAVGAMTAFGLSAQDLPRVADVFANFSNKTFLGAEDLSLALAAVGPVAKNAGLSLEEFSGYMATLAQGGFRHMSDGGTSLKAMLLSLSAPAETAAGAIKQVKLEVYDAQGQMRPLGTILDELRVKLAGMTEQGRNDVLKRMFGTDGIRAATILMGDYSRSLDENSQHIRENIEAMGLSGEAARIAEERHHSFQGQLDILKATWEQLVITMGEQVLPALTNITTGLTGFLDEVKNGGPTILEFKTNLELVGLAIAGVALALKRAAIAAFIVDMRTAIALIGPLPALLGGVTLGINGVSAAAGRLALALGGIPGLVAIGAAAIGMYANSIIADIGRIHDSIDTMEQDSFNSLMKKVEELRKAGDALSLAKAKYLLAFSSLQQAQQGTLTGVDIFGNRQYKVDPKAIELAEKRLAAAKAELEAARAATPNTLSGQGPLLPGQVRTGPASDYGLAIAAQTLKKTGDRQADQLVDFCSRWVRLTLGRAQPEIAGYINRIFSDSNGDGQVLAQDAAANARKAGLLRQYTGTKDLKPGDTVFYTEGGQNHVGVYIGNDMVRGNNRVTYKASGGTNPVGNVNINSLGRVSGVMRADDLLAAARGGLPPLRSAGGTPAGTGANDKLKADIAEGHRLIRQYELAIRSGSEAWITKAHTAIDVFKKGHKDAWGPPLQQALADAEKAFRKTAGSSLDAAKAAAVTEAQYKKLAPRARELANLEAKAKGKGPAAAEAARQIEAWVKKNGAAAKQVLDYERAALRDGVAAAQRAARERVAAEKKAAQERETIARQAEQGQIAAAKNSLERLKVQQAKQLSAVEGNAQAEAKVRLANANQLAAAQKKIAEAQYRADKAAALRLPKASQKEALGNAYATYQNSLQSIENERVQTIRGANKAIADEQARLNRQVLEGRVSDAQATLKRMEAVHERELLNFKGTLAQREALVQRQAQTEANAKIAIAKAQRKLDEAAANKLTGKAQTDALARAKTDYQTALREIENARVRAVQESQKTVKQEEARLQKELLEGRIEDARLTVERITSIHAQELVNFKGTLAQRKALVIRQANEEAAARKAVALAQKRLDDDAANRLTGQARKDALRRAQITYDNAVRGIETDQKKAVQDAGRALVESQKKQEAERNRIIQAARQQNLDLAEGAYRKLQQLREQDLRAAGNSAGKRLAVEQRYAADERRALETIAKLKYDIAVKKANAGEAQLRQGALDLAKQQYDAAMREAAGLTRVSDAQKALGTSVRDLRGEYSRLASGMREKIAAGKVEDADLAAYLAGLDELSQKAKAAGLSNDKMVQGAAANAAALYQQAIDVQVASGAYDGLTDSFNRASGAQARQTVTFQDLLDALPQSADEAEGFTAALKSMAEQGLITNAMVERALLLIPDFGNGLGQLGEEFAEVETHLEGQSRRLDELQDSYDKGLTSTEAYGQGLEELAASYEMQAQAADRLGKTDLASFFRGAAQTALELATNVGHVTTAVRDLQEALDAAENNRLLQEGIAALFTGDAAQVLSNVAEAFSSGAFAELGDEGQKHFLDRLNALLPAADLQALGREKLGALLSGLSTLDGPEVGALRDALQGALAGLNVDVIGADLGNVIERADALRERMAGASDPLELARARTEWEGLVAEAQRLQGVAQDTSLADWVANAAGAIQAEFEAIGPRLEEATGNQLTQGLYTQLGDIIQRAEDLKAELGTSTDPVQLSLYRDAIEQLRSDAEALAARGEGDFAATANTVVSQLEGMVTESASLLDSVMESLGSGTDQGSAALEELLGNITQELDKAQEGLRGGTLGVSDYNDAITTQREALTRLYEQLLALGPAYAGAAASVKLLLDNTADMTIETGKLADALLRADLAASRKAASDRALARQAGSLSAQDFGTQTGQELVRLAQVARNLAEIGKTDAAGAVRATMDEIKKGLDPLAQAQMLTSLLSDSEKELAEVLGTQATPYQEQIRFLELLKTILPEAAAQIDRLIEGYKKLQAKAAGEPMAERLSNLAGIVGTNGKFQKGIKAGLDGLAAYFREGGKKGGSKSLIAGADALVTGLGEVFKTGDEDIDGVIDTFVNGVKGTLSALAKGDWTGAIIAGVTTLVMTVVDIFQGGARSAQKAAQQITDATKNIKIFDTSKYATVVARQGFWGWLGFKEAKIDQESLDIAQNFGDAIYSSVSNGLMEGFKAGKVDAEAIASDLKRSLTTIVVQGLIDGFLKSAGIQAMFQPFLDAYIAAWKARNRQGMADAISGLDTAMIGFQDQIDVFAASIEPLTKRLLDPQATKESVSNLGTQLHDTIAGGFSSGMMEGLKQGKRSFRELGLDVKATLGDQILQGIMDGFLKGEVFKAKIQPLIDQYLAADPLNRVGIAAQIQAALTDMTSGLADLYENVLVPAASQLGVFGSAAKPESNLSSDQPTVLGMDKLDPIQTSINLEVLGSLAQAITTYLPMFADAVMQFRAQASAAPAPQPRALMAGELPTPTRPATDALRVVDMAQALRARPEFDSAVSAQVPLFAAAVSDFRGAVGELVAMVDSRTRRESNYATYRGNAWT